MLGPVLRPAHKGKEHTGARKDTKVIKELKHLNFEEKMRDFFLVQPGEEKGQVGNLTVLIST